ncbi:MAG TPA: hypothetical protein PK733_00980 [Clostridiales bacterium]|mgnify:CR=1 FL=1|nr:hypothetical protein [Clostridiales bacterium]
MEDSINLKEICNWAELFDMTFEYLTFLLEVEDIKPDLVMKTTLDILNNAGYSFSFDEVEEEYYKCL